jgi:hypothetical protein
MRKSSLIFAMIALSGFGNLAMAQDRGASGRPTQSQPVRVLEQRMDKGWDGKVQGLFISNVAFMHLADESDYQRLAGVVLESFNRKWTGGQFKLSRRPYVQTVEKEKYLTIRAEGREGVRTAFFPVSSEGPQGIIIATNGSICHPGSECSECTPSVDKAFCRCSADVKTSPVAKCDYGGGISLAANPDALANLAAVDVGTIGTGSGPIKVDKRTLTAQVANIIPGGFKVTDADIKAIDKEYYSLTSLTNGEGKSYLFISKLENKGSSLGFKSWGFLYHCEGECGFSVPQCEAKSPYIAPNGQLSCGCNGHCYPKYGIVIKWISVKIF